MKKQRKGVLLLNLGTPSSSNTKDVRRYLREFLMDPRVIDISALGRWILVNGFVAPFRSPKSAKEYQKVWTKEGSPLLVHGLQLKSDLQEKMGDEYVVELGMRYQEPSVKSALATFKNKGFESLTIIPLYPQYASATTGSTIEAVNKELNTWQIIPSLRVISNFISQPLYSSAFAEIGNKYWQTKEYEHIVFSYHGLPERQIEKASCDNYCQMNEKCCDTYHSKNQYCYRAQCFETTRLIVEKMNLSPDQYTICFQSRLGRSEWIKPYISNVVPKLAQKGIKKVLVFSPSFVADCLETTIEIGEEYKELFLKNGGEKWQLVESLNTHPTWVECLVELSR